MPFVRLLLMVAFILNLDFHIGSPALAGKLTDAVKARDVAQVRSLSAAGEDVNEKVQREYPINVAAAFGPAEMVAVLLEAGANIEQPGRDGLHPLHNAVIAGRKDTVTVLIEKGAKTNSRDSQGRTPLLWFAAIRGSDMEIAEALLAAGADPKIEETVDQLQPLDFAALNGEVELVKLLLSSGVDINRQTGFWAETALMHAIYHDRTEIVRLLIAQGANVNLTNKKGESPLHYAIGKPVIRRLLEEAGAK